METKKDKFLKLVSKDTTDTIGRARLSQSRRETERASQKIAILILKRLSELNWTQKDLANCMQISEQLVSKWLRGKGNFTIETLFKIQNAIGAELIEIKTITKSENIEFQIVENVRDYQRAEKRFSRSEVDNLLNMIYPYNSTIAIPNNYE